MVSRYVVEPVIRAIPGGGLLLLGYGLLAALLGTLPAVRPDVT